MGPYVEIGSLKIIAITKLSKVIRVEPNLILVPFSEEKTLRYKEAEGKRMCKDGGRGWSSAATNSGMSVAGRGK